jgi:hypothetical protein
MPFVALFGCDSDDKKTTDTTADATGDVGAETSTPGVSPLTGVNTNVTVTTPTRNANCDDSKVDTGNHGAKYPWGGLTAGGMTFTCNKCPTGLADFQGMYRAHGFADDKTTPDYEKGGSAATGDAELLVIDGNTWYSKVYDKQSNTTQETRGWFFCSQKPEHPNEHLFWVNTEVVQGEAQVGGVNRSDVILSQGTDRKLIFWFDELAGDTNVQIAYCKVGTTFNGKTCNNPFN